MDNMNFNRRTDEEIYAPKEYYKKQENDFLNTNMYNSNYGYSSRKQNNYDFLNDNNSYANNNNGLYFDDSREKTIDGGSIAMIIVVVLIVVGLTGFMLALFAAKSKQDKEYRTELIAQSKQQEEIYTNENKQELTEINVENQQKELIEEENSETSSNMQVESDCIIEETGVSGDFYDGTLTYSNKEYGFKCTVGNFFYELDPAYTWQSPYFSYYDCYNFAYERTGDRLDLYSIVMKDSDLYLDEIDKDLFINGILSLEEKFPEEYKYIEHSMEYLGNEELDCITLQFNSEQESMLKVYLKQYYNTILVISFNYAEENEERTQDIIDSFVFVDEYITEEELYQLIKEKSKNVEFGTGWDE